MKREFPSLAHALPRGFIALLLVSLILTTFPGRADAATVVYLTSGTSWIVPPDWNSSSNTIEVIGGSGGGRRRGSGGSGGGAYSSISNLTLTPGSSVTYQVGQGGTGDTGDANNATNGTDTLFNGSGTTCAVNGGSVCAKGGQVTATATGGAGGAAASGIGTVRTSGGAGGNGSSGDPGGGGGGAGGPNGDGGAGGNAASNGGGGGGGGANNGVSGVGGNASGNAGGIAGTGANGGGSGGTGGNAGTPTNATAGATGTLWDSTHGPGGGGGGGGTTATSNAGAGALYGGAPGAGGGGNSSGLAGTQGVIVITYAPIFPSHSSITLTKNTAVTGGASVLGAVSKGSGTFVIDHPLDPKNMLLYHSFVESPDVLNIYDGIITLDSYGAGVIELPSYFLALNDTFQYLGTPIGQPMPNLFLKGEVSRKWFGLFGIPTVVISGGTPGGKVSWQVTGIRKDPFITANPIIPEVEKGPDQLVDKGKYICEECYVR